MFDRTNAILWAKQGNVTIVRFSRPKIMDAAYAKQAGAELKKISERVGGKILVDLSNVLFMSPASIGELITFNKNIRSFGGHLKLCCASPALMQTFAACGVNTIFDIHETFREAIDSFHPGNGAASGSAVS